MDEAPVGVREYPPGCTPLPRKGQKLEMANSRVVEEEVTGSPLATLPPNFHSLDAREQLLERRRIFEALREHFQRRKERGEEFPRPDLSGMKYMNKFGLSSEFRGLGDTPGVLVGDKFDYRSEMFVVGLHCLVQSGIGYTQHSGHSVATSIVLSGGYEDDKDYGDIIYYSGQGGNDYRGEKRQVGDQKPSLGNEALMNSYRLQTPVRVNRGHDVDSSHGWNKCYTYDGLYKVYYAKCEMGASKHKVYKFKLERLPNQPELTTGTVKFTG